MTLSLKNTLNLTEIGVLHYILGAYILDFRIRAFNKRTAYSKHIIVIALCDARSIGTYEYSDNASTVICEMGISVIFYRTFEWYGEGTVNCSRDSRSAYCI